MPLDRACHEEKRQISRPAYTLAEEEQARRHPVHGLGANTALNGCRGLGSFALVAELLDAWDYSSTVFRSAEGNFIVHGVDGVHALCDKWEMALLSHFPGHPCRRCGQDLETAMSSAVISTELPMSIRQLFVAAGWQLGRQVSVPQPIATNHPAATIMAEFAGLAVGRCGPGEECATSDVRFCEIYPDESVTEVWGKLLDTELVGLAKVHHAHSTLYIDTMGRYFEACLHDVLCFAGASFGEAMEVLLLGRHARPMLRPDQPTVMIYGKEIAADHPSVYRYR
jgi:hypothetical protein